MGWWGGDISSGGSVSEGLGGGRGSEGLGMVVLIM